MLNLNLNWVSDTIKTLAQWWPVVKSNFQQIQDKHNALESRVDQIITTPIDGQAAAQELVDARGGEPTLGDRLDNMGAQLNNKVDKVAGKGLSTNDYTNEDKTEVAKVAAKADKSYVDTQIANVASGSPKGVYATLTDLQTAYPTGATGIYVITEDGKWYYWNGSAWTAGGIYQATGIAEKSVGMKETAYLMAEGIPSKNLFTTKWELGNIASLTGQPTASENKIITKDYIKVKPDTAYTVTDPDRISSNAANAQFVFEYDNNKNFIKFTAIYPNPSTTFTTSPTTYYIKFESQKVGVGNYVIGDYENFKTQLEEGEQATKYTSPYPKVGTDNIADGSVTKEKLDPNLLIESGLPSCYEDEKREVISKVFNNITSPKNAVFGLIADIQSCTWGENTKNLIEHYTNINYLCKELPVSFIANLGDFINGNAPKSQTLEKLKKYISLVINSTPVPYFITKGNHDDNSYYTMNNGNPFDELITNEDWYKYVIKYFERFPQFVFDDENRQGGYCYFDDYSSKIRFIFVNTYETAYIRNEDGTAKYDAMHCPAISDKQIQWLAHKALNFMDKPDRNEWAVVAFAHYVHVPTKNYSLLLGIINAFKEGTSFTGSTTDEDYASSVSVDFTDQGSGEFITFICGDSHKDIDFMHLNYGIYQFTVLSSYYPDSDRNTREKGTDTQDSFNIVIIDRENKLIKLIRFGAGEDRVLNYGDYTPKYPG